MYNICIHRVVFELCVTEERRKKERKKVLPYFLICSFPHLVLVFQTNWLDLNNTVSTWTFTKIGLIKACWMSEVLVRC